MIFSEKETREDILQEITRNKSSLDNVVAMSCIGAAFCSIAIFEDLVAALVVTSKAKIRSKLNHEAVEKADLFLERHRVVRSFTLGKLVTVMEESGIEGRDIRYLRALVTVRNDFVHDFMNQMPLPGDWERYGLSLEDFSIYTRRVARHFNFASSTFSRIMLKYGLVAGNFGCYGALLWNPDDSWLQN